jgi:glycosyltransferase involved in cell wall biosynthesis
MLSAKWFKAVIVPSQAKVEEWKKMTPFAGNVVAIPNVVKFFNPKDKCEARRTFGIPKDAKVALFCSRLDPEKRPLHFIKAIEHASTNNHNLIGVMAGSGELAAQCQEQAKGLPIQMLGYVTDVETLYSAADVFVQPSAYESFAITLLQAVALGLPCVASDIPVFKEMYGELDSVQWWESENEEDLAEAILQQTERKPGSGNPTHSISILNTQHSTLSGTPQPPLGPEPVEGLPSTLDSRYSEATVVKAHLDLYKRVLGK